jgi:hypothetical protein
MEGENMNSKKMNGLKKIAKVHKKYLKQVRQAVKDTGLDAAYLPEYFQIFKGLEDVGAKQKPFAGEVFRSILEIEVGGVSFLQITNKEGKKDA